MSIALLFSHSSTKAVADAQRHLNRLSPSSLSTLRELYFTFDFMTSFLWFFYYLAIVLFIGKIVTFSFLVAPVVHSQLEKEDAAKVLRIFFPRYYKMGIASAILGLVSGILILRSIDIRIPHLQYAEIIWAFLLLTEVYSLKVLLPDLNATREARNLGDVEATARWEARHKLSVRLNVVNLLAGLGIVGLLAA